MAMKDKPIGRQRGKLVPEASGRVLEIGLGSGRNLPYYDADKVQELIGVEPSLELAARADKLAQQAGLEKKLKVLPTGAEEMPLEDKSVDTVVMTYTLCSVLEVDRALAEIMRVMKPSARLLFSEHGRAPDSGVRRWQNALNPLWKRIAGGCHLNRDIPGLLRKAGFRLEGLEELYLPGPRPLRYNYLGVARPGS